MFEDDSDDDDDQRSYSDNKMGDKNEQAMMENTEDNRSNLVKKMFYNKD